MKVQVENAAQEAEETTPQHVHPQKRSSRRESMAAKKEEQDKLGKNA